MLNSPLYKKIKTIRTSGKRIMPPADWVESTRSTLLMQVKNTMPVRPVKAGKALQGLLKLATPVRSLVWMRTPAAALAAVVLALFGGSLFSVSAAERAMPGDILYSVKLATEQARLAMTKNPEDRIKLKTEFTGRRVDEIKKVISQPSVDRTERVLQTAEVLKRDLHTLKQQLDETKSDVAPETVMEVAKIVDAKANDVMQTLQDSKSTLTPEEKAKVTEAQVAASDASVKAIEVLVTTHEHAGDVVTEQDVADVLKGHSDSVVKAMSDTLGGGAIVSSTAMVMASGTKATVPLVSASTTNSAIKQMADAQQTFLNADKLAAENKFDEAVTMLKSGTTQAFAAQKTVETNMATSTPAVLPTTTPTTTVETK